MGQRRGPVIVWSAGVAAGALAAATLIATGQKNPFADPWVIALAVVGGLALALLIVAGIPDLMAWIADGFGASMRSGLANRVRRPRRRPVLEAGRWAYTSDAVGAMTAATALEVALTGTNYMWQAEEHPPWTRYVVLLACGTVGPDFGTREARVRFLFLLSQPPVSELVTSLIGVPAAAAWSKRAAYGPAVFEAVLTSGTDDDALASARLELPDGSNRYGRDGRYAALIIHVRMGRADTSDAQAVAPAEWDARITRLLQAVPDIVGFIAGQLGLAVTAEPPAQVAVRIESPKDLAQLFDLSGLEALPGGQHMRQANGYFSAAALDGESADRAATRMIRHVLDYAFKIDI